MVKQTKHEWTCNSKTSLILWVNEDSWLILWRSAEVKGRVVRVWMPKVIKKNRLQAARLQPNMQLRHPGEKEAALLISSKLAENQQVLLSSQDWWWSQQHAASEQMSRCSYWSYIVGLGRKELERHREEPHLLTRLDFASNASNVKSARPLLTVMMYQNGLNGWGVWNECNTG